MRRFKVSGREGKDTRVLCRATLPGGKFQGSEIKLGIRIIEGYNKVTSDRWGSRGSCRLIWYVSGSYFGKRRVGEVDSKIKEAGKWKGEPRNSKFEK